MSNNSFLGYVGRILPLGFRQKQQYDKPEQEKRPERRNRLRQRQLGFHPGGKPDQHGSRENPAGVEAEASAGRAEVGRKQFRKIDRIAGMDALRKEAEERHQA